MREAAVARAREQACAGRLRIEILRQWWQWYCRARRAVPVHQVSPLVGAVLAHIVATLVCRSLEAMCPVDRKAAVVVRVALGEGMSNGPLAV